jgi:predicted AAA+ superfamily ATPase
MEAMEKFGLKEGLILTHEQEDEMTLKGKRIRVMPAWKWMLEDKV